MNAQDNTTNTAPPQLPPEAVLPQMILGGLMQKSIWVAAKLGIADLIAEKPRAAEELAAATDAHAPSLYRVLRFLAMAGVFAENSDGEFELTPIAELLRSDTPNSMRDYAIMMGEDWIWQAYGELMHTIKTGEIAHDKVQGMSSFEYYAQNEEVGKIFNRAMTNLSLLSAPAIVEAYDFSDINKLVDIAGGHGLLLAAILKANPHLQGVLFDLPFVIEGAGELLESEGVTARTEKVSGDFFENIPAGADAYLMKHIIHDWNVEQSVKILQNIRRAVNDDGKVLIAEMVVPEGNEPSPAKGLDLVMLTIEGGKERTEKEYQELLEAAGLRLTRVIPTRSPFSIIEAVKN